MSAPAIIQPMGRAAQNGTPDAESPVHHCFAGDPALDRYHYGDVTLWAMAAMAIIKHLLTSGLQRFAGKASGKAKAKLIWFCWFIKDGVVLSPGQPDYLYSRALRWS
ncbi:MAG: hypothetical protein R3C68_12670 [Myxococcota bacterium]